MTSLFVCMRKNFTISCRNPDISDSEPEYIFDLILILFPGLSCIKRKNKKRKKLSPQTNYWFHVTLKVYCLEKRNIFSRIAANSIAFCLTCFACAYEQLSYFECDVTVWRLNRENKDYKQIKSRENLNYNFIYNTTCFLLQCKKYDRWSIFVWIFTISLDDFPVPIRVQECFARNS